MDKKVPLRMCVVTGEIHPKKELLRIVKAPDGTFAIDDSGRANGRGAYVIKDPKVVALAKKSKALDRAFRSPVPESLYEALEAYFK